MEQPLKEDSIVKPSDRLEELGYVLPPVPPKPGSFIPAIRVGNLVYCSGQGPYQNGKHKYLGRVGKDVMLDEAYEAARIAAMNCLASISSIIGSIDFITRVIQLRCFINSADSFHSQPEVANGASDFLLAIFGEAGNHVRSALGTSNLPRNIPIEIEMIVEVRE